MATGIRKLHSRGCRSRGGRRCNCGAGYEAFVYLAREGKKVRKTFTREAEAKSWRADALAAASRGALRPIQRDGRTLAAALAEFIEGPKPRSRTHKRTRPARPSAEIGKVGIWFVHAMRRGSSSLCLATRKPKLEPDAIELPHRVGAGAARLSAGCGGTRQQRPAAWLTSVSVQVRPSEKSLFFTPSNPAVFSPRPRR
jgi:hypothetical protein